MVYTIRLAGHGRPGGRTRLEQLLADHHITQKNGAPHRPTTQGKAERFQQTTKNWLRAEPRQPDTLHHLGELLTTFREHYNTRRPHRSLPHRSTPTTAYHAASKAARTPGMRDSDTHDRVRHDCVDASGVVMVRQNGKLHHIGTGRTHARTHVILLIQDLEITVINAVTGDVLRELTLNLNRDYQPQAATTKNTQHKK
ncbi:integrase core domain-containing protein [Leucobacter sp. NPDC077196]|uniref:integrase core domain-containing protein n=1 Tax=Leucobacter sp. NPDC077196 TaxID=3154959 RepID=UPI00341BF7CC